MTTLLTDARQKTAATGNSILEKLKSLRSTVSQNVVEDVDELSSTISGETSKVSDEISKDVSSISILTIIKYIFIFLLLGIILINILAIIGLLPLSLAEIFILFYYLNIIIFLRKLHKNRKILLPLLMVQKMIIYLIQQHPIQQHLIHWIP